MSTPERKFLHDISSPLMIAQGMLDIISKTLAETVDETTRERLQKIEKALDRISQNITEHRKYLRSLESDSSDS